MLILSDGEADLDCLWPIGFEWTLKVSEYVTKDCLRFACDASACARHINCYFHFISNQFHIILIKTWKFQKFLETIDIFDANKKLMMERYQHRTFSSCKFLSCATANCSSNISFLVLPIITPADSVSIISISSSDTDWDEWSWNGVLAPHICPELDM